MRNLLFPSLALMACTFLSGSAAAQDEGIDWISNYQDALTLAKKSGKPIFLEFRCEA